MRQRTRLVALLMLGAWSLVAADQTTWAQPPTSPNLVPTDSMQDPLDAQDPSQNGTDPCQPVVDANGNFCPPPAAGLSTRLFFSVDALFLNLNRARSRDLVLDQNTLAPRAFHQQSFSSQGGRSPSESGLCDH